MADAHYLCSGQGIMRSYHAGARWRRVPRGLKTLGGGGAQVAANGRDGSARQGVSGGKKRAKNFWKKILLSGWKRTASQRREVVFRGSGEASSARRRGSSAEERRALKSDGRRIISRLSAAVERSCRAGGRRRGAGAKPACAACPKDWPRSEKRAFPPRGVCLPAASRLLSTLAG